MEDRVGLILEDKYEILKKIGQGGMSIVYVAMDTRLNKQWAIKEIKNDGTQSTEMLLRGIETEANILKKVDHPVLPRIVDIIDKDGTIFVVMDYIEGRPLNNVLREEGAQSQEKVIEWAKQLGSALDYLHSMNPPIIYRDMKPSNIMLKPDGNVKLIDFGTAKEYKAENIADTTALGTRGYAAPEQFGDAEGRGIHKTDARTDIYCLGATLYHILTGKNPSEPPYEMKPIREWNPMLSGGIEKILIKCTQSNPKDRYQNCSELIYAFENYDQLDGAYRKKNIGKLAVFATMLLLSFASLGMGIAGYSGMIKERDSDYRTLIETANNYKIDGDYTQASQMYVKAITEVDGKNSEAYIDLLNLYINYMNPNDGLSRIEGYINADYQGIGSNSEVLFKVGVTYFDVIRDYRTSLTYLRMVDEKEIPEARYYKVLATYLSEMDVDPDFTNMQSELVEFEKFNDEKIVSETQIINYKSLGTIYASYIDILPDAPEKIIEIAGKGLDSVDKYTDNSIKAEYIVEFDQQLVVAYIHKGDETENANDKKTFYNEAISYCNDIRGIISVEDDAGLVEQCICDLAEMYSEIGETEKALEEYKNGETELGTECMNIYIGHLSLLCDIQQSKDTNVEKWETTEIFQVYDNAKNISGIEDDIRWKRLVQKLEPLLKVREK